MGGTAPGLGCTGGVPRWGLMSPGSDTVLVLQCDGLHHIFPTCRCKSPAPWSQVTIQGTASAPPWVTLSATQQHRSPFHSPGPVPRRLLPTGTAWGQPGVWPSHTSDLVVGHWIHLSVSQVEVSLRVKCSYFSFTDGEAEAQKSAFCPGPHKRPGTEL